MYVRSKLQQRCKRIAIGGQAQYAAIDVMLAHPTIEVPAFGVEGHHAIGVSVRPDHPGFLPEQPVSKEIGMKRRRARPRMGQAITVTGQHGCRISQFHAFGHVLERAVVVEYHFVARIAKRHDTELLKIAQRPFHP